MGRAQPAGECLAGKPEHQVEAHVRESCGAGVANGLTRAFGRVHASEPLEFRLLKGLDTETDAIDSGGKKRLEPGGRRGLRICFERDFGVRLHVEGIAARCDERRDLAGLEQ